MAQSVEWSCPDYRVRVSPRAKHVRLKIDHGGQLEIVIPQGFNRHNIPAIIYRKRDWLHDALQRLQQQPPPQPNQPERLELQAIGETRSLRFMGLSKSAPSPQLHETPSGELHIYSAANESELQRELIRQWLIRRARRVMEPEIRRLSQQLGLPFKRLSIRTQRSRWGSCSSQGNINLNALLLFLPPECMRSVLIHELCHLRHPNHSPAFWDLVARHDPDCQQTRSSMRHAWRSIPAWLTGQ